MFDWHCIHCWLAVYTTLSAIPVPFGPVSIGWFVGRFVVLSGQIACRLRPLVGHSYMIEGKGKNMYLICTNCDYRTKGWSW